MNKDVQKLPWADGTMRELNMAELMMNELTRHIERANLPMLNRDSRLAKPLVFPNGSDVIVMKGMDDIKKGETSIVSYNREKAVILRRQKGEEMMTTYEYSYETEQLKRNNQLPIEHARRNILEMIRDFEKRNKKIQVLTSGQKE